jgi:hypothetical protein
VVDSVTNADDNSGSVEAGRVGKIQIRPVEPGTDLGINRVDSSRLSIHHYLARTRRKIGDFFQLHHFGRAEGVDTYRFHMISPVS